MQRSAERTLQSIFEAFKNLSLEYNDEEELKQLSTELGMMITEVEAIKPVQLSLEDTFMISDMYMRYGHTLENKAAIDVYQSAYDQINVRSMPRTFRWHLWAARLRYNQALSDAKPEGASEKYFSQSCQLLCDALTINGMDASEKKALRRVY